MKNAVKRVIGELKNNEVVKIITTDRHVIKLIPVENSVGVYEKTDGGLFVYKENISVDDVKSYIEMLDILYID